MTWTTCNSAPDARNDSATTEFNTAVTVTVLANDFDPDCDPLRVTGTSGSANGTVTVNANGTITFTPTAGFYGTTSFTYTITDGHGGYDTATVTVTVCEPPSDGIVSGTVGADLIDTTYTGDPDGDMVDHNDAILPGETGDDDIIKAGAGNDTILAGAGNDEVYGEDGDDLIYGGAGNDYLSGGAGDDTFVGGTGNDTYEGNTGLDMIDYSASSAGVSVNLSTGALSGGDAAGDAIAGGIDGVIGSDYADSLVGFDHEGTTPEDTYTNVFYGNGGDDTIQGMGSDDSLYGGADDDSIEGGAGNDFIQGDGVSAATGGGEALSVDWAAFKQDCGTIVSGSSYDMGGVSVTFGFTAQDSGATASVYNATQYVESGDGLSAATGLQLYGCGGEGGIDNTSTTTLSFAATDEAYGDTVSDVTFRINDIDVGPNTDYHQDIVTIRAYDADGNLLPVTYTVEGGQTVSGNTITAHDLDSSGTISPASATGSVLVQISGEVARIEIDYDNGGYSDQAITLTDINCVTTDGDETGAEGDDTLLGGAGDDTILGDGGNDLLTGGTGADSLSGGDDRDSFFVASASEGVGDVVDGGEGGDDFDVLDLTGAGPVNVIYDDTNPENGTVEFLNADGDVVGTLEFTNIERVIADQGDGIVEGTESADLIDYDYTGDPEGDMIDHEDALIAGDAPNDDRVLAGAGNDTVYAGAGDDTVAGEEGDDLLYGGAGDDSLTGSYGDDTLYGGTGNDTLDAGPDGDVLYGEEGDDRLLGGPGEDLLDGGLGNDTIIGGGNGDTIVGGDGSDSVEGSQGNDLIDTSGSAPKPDLAYPGLWTADADPNDDKDTVYGGDGNDTITTGDDADYVDGGEGNDVINAGIDADTVYGGTGNDVITSGEGSDFVDGGDGDDTIYGGVGPGYPDAINVPDSTDPVQNNGDDTIHGGAGNDVIYGEDDNDLIYGEDGNDYIDGGIDGDTIYGGAGSDTIVGGGDNDLLVGGADDDTFIINTVGLNGVNNVTVDGSWEGNDNDTLDYSALLAQGYEVVNLVKNPETNGNPGFNGQIQLYNPTTNQWANINFTDIENIVPCFTPGTLVATPRGEKLVEDLAVGDKVITRDNGLQEIRWVGRRDLSRTELMSAPHLKPVLIRAGSLGNGLPDRDMLVSPNHRMLVANERTALYFEEHEVLVAAKHLVDNRGVKTVETLGTSYLHFMFDRHEVLLANGCWSESFQPGDQTLGGMGNAQRSEIFELFPELRTAEGVESYGAARKTLKRHEAKLLMLGG
ncbi:Hint domain-containing protein [Paenirhodobacter sp. CAU 1674]|uniref:Hint domain-containing protein n=1 Tax=Paenirhodobacter sp. CAU 1674 TaxID=3032596 RepID=UPI0023DA75E7|nr:Hint domain-containing protein [Paenirhodobacter sp. CAU 1674]MDF2142421.1 Hint domain-containing protein [Paenirhodobacter sp. CAU 1674]